MTKGEDPGFGPRTFSSSSSRPPASAPSRKYVPIDDWTTWKRPQPGLGLWGLVVGVAVMTVLTLLPPVHSLLAEIAKNCIRVLRSETVWSQAELAERVSVSRNSINSIENGKVDPSLPLAFRIAAAFGLTIEQVFVRERDDTEGSTP